MNLDRLLADIKDSRTGEGFRAHVYPDPKGVLTIGFGRNLVGNGISPEEADYLLHHDIERVTNDLRQRVPWVLALDDVRQRAVIEIGFIAGVVGLLGFTKMLAALQAEEWVTASNEFLHSRLATQIQPARCDRIRSMLLTGQEL